MRAFFTATFVSLVATAPLAAAPIISPNANANSEAGSNNGYPFNLTPFGFNSQRYQQVYAASQFPSGPVLITQLLFRPDAVAGTAFSGTLPNVQINLSTTAAGQDALSGTFAANVGGNDTVVFSGPLSLASTNTGGPPRDFDIVINLTAPFLYNPGNGNLLLDVRNFGGGATTQFDAAFLSADGVSRVFTNTANGVNSLTGEADTSGLVTQFNFQPVTATPIVPEPTTLTVFGLLAVAGIGYARRRKGAALLVAPQERRSE